MKRIITALVLCCLLALAGCDDKDAREYAKELSGVVKSYQSELNKKIKVEKDSYKDLAGTYAYAQQVSLSSDLGGERLRRKDELADQLLYGDAKVTPADIHAMLIDYAEHDFDATRQMLERESDGQAEYLASLQSLEMQAQSLEALSKALDELAKPKSNIKQLKELAAAAQEFRTKLVELQCDDFARQIACLKKQKAALEQEAAPLDEAVEADLTRKRGLLGEAKALGDEIERLTKQFQSGGCKAEVLTNATCPDN